MSTAVFRRIESRRNKNICGLIRYLESPQNYDQIFQQFRLEYPKKKELLQVARDLFVRLFPNESTEETNAECYQPPVKKTKAAEWNILSKHSGVGSTAIQTPHILNHIKKEMMVSEATQKCPKALKRLKICLDTFQPSSLKAERHFCAAGLLITNLRAWMSDYLINLLCFMSSNLNQ